ncbi:MAG: DUF4249 family protein [bacterium]|nr:DUF4249 family protein [bacterium]
MLFSVHISCYQDVIEIDLSDAGSNIVIKSLLNDQGYNIVQIVRPSDFYTGGDYPPVSDALVILSDDTGNSEVLERVPDDSLGLYQAPTIEGVPGREYTLSVLADNEEYSAVSKMPLPLVVDSIWNEYELDGDPVIKIQFDNRVGIKDHCRFLVYRYYSADSYENLTDEDIFLYYDREENEGEKITYEFDDFWFDVGAYLVIEVLSIDENMYQYYSTLKSLIDNEGVQEDYEEGPDADSVIFPLTSFNPTSNMSNNALGYFSAYSYQYFVLIIDH